MKQTISAVLAFLLMISCFFAAGCKAKPYQYQYEKYITLPAYESLKLDTEDLSYQMGLAYKNYSNLSQLDMDDMITQTELKKGKVQILDNVNIDYVGRKDGVAFEGGSAKGYDLLIGSSSFISGFELGLVGVKIGDTVELPLTFPENYHSKELAGQKVVFTVTVNRLNRPIISPITKEVAQEMGYLSAEDYHERLENEYFSEMVWKKCVEQTTVHQYPEKEINTYLDSRIEQLRQQAEANAVTLEDMLAAYQMTEEDYRGQLMPNAESTVLQNMICYAIAKKENIVISKEEIKKHTQTSPDGNTVSKDQKQSIYESLLHTKVVEFLVEKAKG